MGWSAKKNSYLRREASQGQEQYFNTLGIGINATTIENNKKIEIDLH